VPWQSQPLYGQSVIFQVAPEVIIDNVLSARHTVLEIAGLDRPGLLYDLTTAIGKLNLNIASAHIATFGEKAVDVFYVTDLTNAKIVSTARQLAIRKALLEVFEPEGEKAAATRARAPARSTIACSVSDQLAQRAFDRADAAEHVALEHVVGKLDVELAFQRQHDVDAGMGGHAVVVKVGVGGEPVGVDGQAAMITQYAADGRIGLDKGSHDCEFWSRTYPIVVGQGRNHSSCVVAVMAQTD